MVDDRTNGQEQTSETTNAQANTPLLYSETLLRIDKTDKNAVYVMEYEDRLSIKGIEWIRENWELAVGKNGPKLLILDMGLRLARYRENHEAGLIGGGAVSASNDSNTSDTSSDHEV